MRRRADARCLILTTLLLAGSADPGNAQTTTADPSLREDFFEALEYRPIGPVGNRVIAVVGEPGDANVYYVGAASGGVWKSTDGGHHWRPTFDDMPASSIGALAVAPSDPNVVWAGTGETFIRSNISIGNGVYRSTDRGESWEHRGLDATGRIGRVIVHPRDPDTVWVCALGHAYGPQEERGVFRTVDGGASWQRVLFIDPDTGCSDLAIDPTNPRHLFAGFWQIEIRTWGRTSGGDGSSLWRSRDGGVSWEQLAGSGLPEPPWGKIGLTLSAADPRRVYALIETSSNRDFAPSDPFQGALWRSDDRGASWRMVNASLDLMARPLYYTRALAAPDDADEVHFLALQHRISLDGGLTDAASDPQPGGDHHDMWIDPQLPQRRIVGHDQGISISTDGGRSWYRPQLPIAQMYHVAVDDRIPYRVYGNRQDGPSTHGPSNTLTGSPNIPIGAWRPVGGCEVGFAIPDPVDRNVVWSGCYDGRLDRHDLETGHSRDVSVWPDAIESWAAIDLELRFQWTQPIALSPHDHRRLYAGSQHLHVTEDGGQSWRRLSGDLTSNDPELQQRTGGLTLDDAGPTIAPVVFAIAESPREPGEIWVGTNDGFVQLTRDGGATWTDLTGNLVGVPERGTVSNIEPSRHAAGTAYLTVDRHQLGDPEPYVLKTTDHGATWSRIDADLPRDVFGYAHCVREDPVRPGLLFLGTENALHVSFDDGVSWRELRANLPRVPVHWLVVQERFSDLVVATYGRGFWILDDLTPLRQIAAAGPGDAPLLFAPRPAWRFREREAAMSQPGDPAAGRNPPYGATLHYYLPADLDDATELELAVLRGDAGEDETSGEAAVVTLEDPPRTAGLHRLVWDLRGAPTREVRLRTPPQENPHFPMPESGWRPLRDGRRIELLVPPGRYTVRLRIGDTILSEDLEVLRDPSSAGTDEDLRRQRELLEGLHDLQDRAATVINHIEWIRSDLDGLAARLGASGRVDREALIAAVDAVDAALREVEGAFFDLRLTGTGQDSLRWRRLLYARMAQLAARIGQSDHRPTDAHLEVYGRIRADFVEQESRFQELLAEDVAGLNERLRDAGVAAVVMGLGEDSELEP